MRTAILGDIHGCYEGLLAVMMDIREKGVSRRFCLGDLVDLGPNPKECVEKAMEHFDYTIMGNHDRYFVKGYVPSYIRDLGTINSHRWTKKNWFDPGELRKLKDELDVVSEETLLQRINSMYKANPPKNSEEAKHYYHLLNLAIQEPYFDFLESLKPELPTETDAVELKAEGIILSHGFPPSMLKYADELGVDGDDEAYVVNEKQWRKKGMKKRFVVAEKLIKKLEKKTILFVAHSHMPFIVNDGDRKIVNVGAVFDARRAGNNIACYALYDDKKPFEDNVEIKRVRYNRRKTEEKIKGLGVLES